MPKAMMPGEGLLGQCYRMRGTCNTVQDAKITALKILNINSIYLISGKLLAANSSHAFDSKKQLTVKYISVRPQLTTIYLTAHFPHY